MALENQTPEEKAGIEIKGKQVANNHPKRKSNIATKQVDSERWESAGNLSLRGMMGCRLKIGGCLSSEVMCS
jgi:hypothetical protein